MTTITRVFPDARAAIRRYPLTITVIFYLTGVLIGAAVILHR